MPVGAQVFVTEAAGDLEIAFDTGDHEQLFHLLGRLWQGVEITRLHPARHQEIPGALRGALDEDRGFDLQEVAVAQEVPDVLDHVVPQCQVAQHGRPPQVQVAVPQAQAFVGLGVFFDVERRGQRSVQDSNLRDHDFHIAGGHGWVLTALGTAIDRAFDLDDPLAPDLFGDPCGIGVGLWVEYNLNGA